MAVYEVPSAAIDAAEAAWYLRLNNGIITPPREHIEALLRAAAPHMSMVIGEVVHTEELPLLDSFVETRAAEIDNGR